MRFGDPIKVIGEITKARERLDRQGQNPQELGRGELAPMGAAIVLAANADGYGSLCEIEALDSNGNHTGLRATGRCIGTLLDVGAVVFYMTAIDGSIMLFSGGATTINQTSQSIVKTYPGGIWYFGPTVP